jgi:hypothetical protein
MKKISCVILAIALAGCDPALDTSLNGYNPPVKEVAATETKGKLIFRTVCLENVSYWIHESSHGGYLAPRFDSRYSQVITC